MDIKIIKELGSGVMGTVYLVESSGKKYIYKIEKMEDAEAYERQVDFDRVAQENSKYFLTLKSHGIINFCPHKQPIPKWVTGSFRKKLIEKNKSSDCYYLIYEPVLKSTLRQLGHSVYTKKTTYKKMVSDVVAAVNAMKKAGFSHNDIHSGNIMSDGDHFFLIDYGRISHKKYKPSIVEKEIKKYNLSDVDMILWNVLVFNKPAIYMMDNDLKWPPLKKFMAAISKHKEYQNEYLKISHIKIQQLREAAAILLTALDHPKIYCECLGLKRTLPVVAPYPELVRYVVDHFNDKNYDAILRYIKRL